MSRTLWFIFILIVLLLIVGCAEKRPDGWCALSYNGACLSKWEMGKKVPAGDIDMRYAGHECRNGAARNIDGTLSYAQWCSGTTTVTAREW